jgi:nucleoside-diphosphate-sugar epimerase
MKALITGGTGFLGGKLARRLHGMGWDVTVLGRNPAALGETQARGIKAIRTNLEDSAAIIAACKGQEIVFHCGALSAPWGKPGDFYAANVLGTANIIHACMDANVHRLVHVSTPSIYFRFRPRLNVREDAELPKPVNEYARTKRLAEERIDRAYTDGLPVITIRPRAIFGPGDTSILPRLIQRLETGRIPIIGDGKNVTDLTYVENAVDALILCAGSPLSTLGKKYNITNGEPIRLWPVIERVCEALHLSYPKHKVPYQVAHYIAWMLEWIYRFLPGQPEPPFTRYSVFVIAQSATLDITAARRELGYRPRVSVEQGLEEFIASKIPK